MTGGSICTNAARENGQLGANEALTSADAQVYLNKLRRLLNNWNAERAAVYAASFATYTLVANLQPHTIGPSTATWATTLRPVSIDGANVIIDVSNPSAYTPIAIHTAQWWNFQSQPGQTSSFPTDLYYQADWPNGKIYFWPVPQAAYQVQLQLRVLLDDALDLDTEFTLPQGYEDALTLTLAESCCGKLFGVDLTPDLQQAARIARARIFNNNDQPSALITSDFGMQGAGLTGNRADFNFLTGTVTSR